MRSRGVTTPLIQREVVFVSITEIIFFYCYRSPSQNSDGLTFSSHKWDETILNINNVFPTAAIFLGYLNVKNSD